MPSMLKFQIEALSDAIPQLSERDREFAQSLVDQFLKRGLSEKQAAWVVRLTERATAPKPEAVEVGDLQGVVKLLETAKQHLKFPAVLVLAGGRTLRLNIAGERSKAPGSINVCSAGGSYGDRDWFGRVNLDGKFEPSPRYDADTQTAVAAALTALALDPAKAAADYGHLTGVCCFCGIVLTDERSTGVGYGPICAKHYGLAWGVAAAKAVQAGEAEQADLLNHAA